MKRIIVVALVLFVFACDTIRQDSDLKASKTINVAVYNNKPTVIDLQKIFPGFKDVSMVDQSEAMYFDSRYISYSPKSSIPSRVTFTVTRKDNTKELVKAVPIGLISKKCAEAIPFTYAKITNTEALSVNLFNNPEFCDFDVSLPGQTIWIAGSQKGVDVNQNTDGLTIAVCSCAANGSTAVLTYVPPTGFVGQVKFTYYLGVGGYPFTGDPNDPQFFTPTGHDYFSKHNVIIDVGSATLAP